MAVNIRPNNPARRYDSPKRRQQADATRRRILVAAERLFAERGYPAVTMQAIARQARISLATLYLHFPGRAAMVGALAEEIVAAPELSVEQVIEHPDPVEQLRAGARVMCQLNERSWLVTDILRSQQGSEPELARLWALWQRRHLAAVHQAITAIATSTPLRPGLSLDEATDVFYALAGTEVYRALIHERGWSPAQYERWIFELASRELFAHPF